MLWVPLLKTEAQYGPHTQMLQLGRPFETLLILAGGSGLGLVGPESGAGEQAFLRKNHSKRQKGRRVRVEEDRSPG